MFYFLFNFFLWTCFWFSLNYEIYNEIHNSLEKSLLLTSCPTDEAAITLLFLRTLSLPPAGFCLFSLSEAPCSLSKPLCQNGCCVSAGCSVFGGTGIPKSLYLIPRQPCVVLLTGLTAHDASSQPSSLSPFPAHVARAVRALGPTETPDF